MPNQPANASFMSSPIFPLALMLLIVYFMMIRPQKQQQKERASMLKGLSKNDQIVTIGGIHGTIVLVKDLTVTVRVDDNVKLEFDKESITKVLKSEKQKNNES